MGWNHLETREGKNIFNKPMAQKVLIKCFYYLSIALKVAADDPSSRIPDPSIPEKSARCLLVRP